jgi:hypothetical protein
MRIWVPPEVRMTVLQVVAIDEGGKPYLLPVLKAKPVDVS